jgi:hypothetical protein|tara:strand:+ start:208 stop:333 length:126 start_codon:yes stop_codon:yes gene_type:complete
MFKRIRLPKIKIPKIKVPKIKVPDIKKITSKIKGKFKKGEK